MGLRLLVLDGGLTVASRDGERGSEGGYVSFERSAEKRERERGHEGKRVDEVRVDDERCCCEIRIYLVPQL